MIWDCQSKHYEVDKKNKVPLVWVPGQSKLKLNEKAKILARKSARTY